MIIGYARVSTDGQSLDAQNAALRTFGAEKVFSCAKDQRMWGN
jgi:DNA invertase Pin-like site-specific DNA recombinase